LDAFLDVDNFKVLEQRFELSGADDRSEAVRCIAMDDILI